MKKTIFILTLLLPFCFLFAQPDADSDQIGINNSVIVDQNGNLNYSRVLTYGNDNTPSFVTQTGHGVNDSYVYQGSFLDAADGNTARVTQDNTALKLGDNNYSKIDQNGDYNDATVHQIAVESMYGAPRTSNIYQHGYDNTADVFQEGKSLNSYINQTETGSYNTGLVNQQGARSDANIRQTGDWNTADVQQEGLRNTADIDQLGYNGTAKQYQGKAEYMSSGTETKYNEAKILQTVNVNGGLAEQYQEGRQNYANIHQDAGGLSRAIQIQVNTKENYVFPRGTDLNIARINQSGGTANQAYQLQHYSELGDPNIANSRQIGSNNYSLEEQYGGSNISDVDQTGNTNTAVHIQNEHSILHSGYTGLPIGF